MRSRENRVSSFHHIIIIRKRRRCKRKEQKKSIQSGLSLKILKPAVVETRHGGERWTDSKRMRCQGAMGKNKANKLLNLTWELT